MEDTGISYKQILFNGDTWPDAKKAGIESGIYPFGQVPAIVTDSGFSLAQSHAIVHYLGRTKGLDCECIDIQQCEVLAAGAEDLDTKVSKLVYASEFMADMWDDYQKNVAPIWLAHFEKLAPQIRSEETSFFTGGRITWVDYVLFNMLDRQVEFGKIDVGLPPVDVLEPYPKLSSFYNRFRVREKIASYLSSDRRLPYNPPKVTKVKKEQKKED